MNPILASQKSHSNGLGVDISKRDDGANRSSLGSLRCFRRGEGE
jgi:hypothetical protein